jgi:hypothetical protein
MANLFKHVTVVTALAAVLLCAPSGAGAERSKRMQRAPTVLSRPELVGLVHCLRYCGKDGWFGSGFDGGKGLRLRYEIVGPSPDRPGFDVAVAVYSAKENSGLFFDVNWDGKSCGLFTVVDDGSFARRRGAWVWTTAPLGGLWTRWYETRNLRAVMARGHVVTVEESRREKGCGDWGTPLLPGGFAHPVGAREQ